MLLHYTTFWRIQSMEKVFLNNKQFDKSNLPEVSVIDAPCGTGKTNYSIDEINSTTNPVVFCTPFIKEIQRIADECERVVSTVILKKEKDKTTGETIVSDVFSKYHKENKIDFVKELLAQGKSISISHEILKLLDEECYGYIQQHGYKLYLDEVITSVENMGVSPHDIKEILGVKDAVVLAETKEVVWLNQDYYGKHDKVMRAVKAGDVYCVDVSDKKQLFVWELSICKFIFFKEVTLLTYLFEGSELSCFFKINRVPYVLHSMKDYKVVPYDRKLENREELKKLINIYNGKANKNFGGTLSATYYKNNKNADEIKQIKKNVEGYFKNTLKAKNSSIMWSCYKNDISKLKFKRCTNNNYVPFNSRATNDYRERTNLAYLINVFIDPDILQYFNSYGVDLDQDLYAVSTLVQWLCRSAIRDGKPVNIYLPSQRMRDLLNKFFNYET